MDIRDVGGLVGRAGAGLKAFNQRHPWSHNDHFHGWILRHLPANRGSALDVGCGRGQLAAALATRFDRVLAVDADAEMARLTGDRLAGDSRVTVRHARFEEVTGQYDLITMVAVLHHLEPEPALRHANRLLAAGGRLLVVGLARPATAPDLIWDLASAVANPVVGMIKHPRPLDRPAPPPFPVVDPTSTFDAMKAATGAVLPGARVRRRLFFRYTVDWTKP